MQLPKEVGTNSLLFPLGNAEKIWRYLAVCKIRGWLFRLGMCFHILSSFCSPLRKTCAGKYLGLMRRAKGRELGRWVNVCGTATKEAHLWWSTQNFCPNWGRGRSWVYNGTNRCLCFQSALGESENPQRNVFCTHHLLWANISVPVWAEKTLAVLPAINVPLSK